MGTVLGLVMIWEGLLLCFVVLGIENRRIDPYRADNSSVSKCDTPKMLQLPRYLALATLYDTLYDMKGSREERRTSKTT